MFAMGLPYTTLGFHVLVLNHSINKTKSKSYMTTSQSIQAVELAPGRPWIISPWLTRKVIISPNGGRGPQEVEFQCEMLRFLSLMWVPKFHTAVHSYQFFYHIMKFNGVQCIRILKFPTETFINKQLVCILVLKNISHIFSDCCCYRRIRAKVSILFNWIWLRKY